MTNERNIVECSEVFSVFEIPEHLGIPNNPEILERKNEITKPYTFLLKFGNYFYRYSREFDEHGKPTNTCGFRTKEEAYQKILLIERGQKYKDKAIIVKKPVDRNAFESPYKNAYLFLSFESCLRFMNNFGQRAKITIGVNSYGEIYQSLSLPNNYVIEEMEIIE